MLLSVVFLHYILDKVKYFCEGFQALFIYTTAEKTGIQHRLYLSPQGGKGVMINL